LGRARTQNDQSQSQMFEGVCPARWQLFGTVRSCSKLPDPIFQGGSTGSNPVGATTETSQVRGHFRPPNLIASPILGSRLGRATIRQCHHASMHRLADRSTCTFVPDTKDERRKIPVTRPIRAVARSAKGAARSGAQRTLGRKEASDLITMFITYAHEDVDLARSIQERVEAARFKVWIDEGARRAGALSSSRSRRPSTRWSSSSRSSLTRQWIPGGSARDQAGDDERAQPRGR
jgi:hypothetical protein